MEIEISQHSDDNKLSGESTISYADEAARITYETCLRVQEVQSLFPNNPYEKFQQIFINPAGEYGFTEQFTAITCAGAVDYRLNEKQKVVYFVPERTFRILDHLNIPYGRESRE